MALVNQENTAATTMNEHHTKNVVDPMEIDMGAIKETFKADFLDEMNDCNSYCDMAKAAEMMGQSELARGLYMISHDEYTHAKFIHDHLIDWGCEIPEKEMMRWHELKERIHRIFHR